MKSFNTVKIDQKGRIKIPFHICNYMGLKKGTELIITNNKRKEIKIFPLLENTLQIEILLKDITGSLAKILDVVSKNNVDILMSTSNTTEKGKLAEWCSIVDISNCKNIKKFQKELKSLSIVKKIKIDEFNNTDLN